MNFYSHDIYDSKCALAFRTRIYCLPLFMHQMFIGSDIILITTSSPSEESKKYVSIRLNEKCELLILIFHLLTSGNWVLQTFTKLLSEFEANPLTMLRATLWKLFQIIITGDENEDRTSVNRWREWSNILSSMQGFSWYLAKLAKFLRKKRTFHLN